MNLPAVISLQLLLVLPMACAPAPPPPAAAPAPVASAPARPPAAPTFAPLPAACKELADPMHDLRDLVMDTRSYDPDHERPLYPFLLASKLTADAAIARAVTSPDQEILRIAAGTGDLLAAL